MDDRHIQDLDDRLDLAFAGGPRPLGQDPLLRLFLVNWLIGAAVAVVLVAFVLITDTAHLRSLMMASSEPWLPMLLLFFGFLITMCSVAIGAAVMMLPSKDDDDDQGPGGGSPLEALGLPGFPRTLKPIPIRVEASPHRRRDPRRGY